MDEWREREYLSPLSSLCVTLALFMYCTACAQNCICAMETLRSQARQRYSTSTDPHSLLYSDLNKERLSQRESLLSADFPGEIRVLVRAESERERGVEVMRREEGRGCRGFWST